MTSILVDFVSLFFAGILAGEELVIRYGLSVPLAALDDQPHIELRQSLIRRLRVLVPILFAATVVSGASALAVDWRGPGFGYRGAGLFALLTFISITLFGTVPINKGALAWQPAAPPSNWRALISRWQRLDTARSWAAVLAFALFLTTVAQR